MNRIGIDISGLHLIENGNTGIKIESAEHMILSSNIVAGWKEDGIIFDGTGGTIASNSIGLGRNLETDFGNGQNGLVIQGNNNLVELNNVGGNKANGILVENLGNNTFKNNVSFGNKLSGIQIANSSNNTIEQRNQIFGNGVDGISVGIDSNDVSVNNAILENSIYKNGGLGINIHLEDKTSKPNNAQISPMLTAAALLNESQILVLGRLESVANTEFEIQFFATDDNKRGQGKTFINSIRITTDNKGSATFAVTINVPLEAQPVTGYLTATATRFVDGLTDTSQFSNPVQIR